MNRMFPMSRPAHRPAAALLLSLAAFAAAAPAVAQDSQAPSAPANPSAGLEPVAVDGFRMFVELMRDFAREQFAKLPAGDKSARENAYGKLAAIQLAGAGSALALPAAGLALGGGIGLCVDVCTAGADAGAGTLIGGSIGLGSGIVVGGGAFVASLLATLPLVDEIEAKYPADQGAAGGTYMLRGEHLVLPLAGPFESFYVNMVAALPEPFVTLFQQWDRTPGLGARERAWLQSVEFARPHLQRLAWIKRNLRVSPQTERAADLFLDVGRVLSGDTAAMERAWLAALGLGATGLELKNDKLALRVPPTLQQLGLPARLTANVPELKVKIGGSGGALDPYLRCHLEAGPFDVDWGTVRVVKSGADRDLVAIEYSVAKGSRLGSARLRLKAGGDETTVAELKPTLDRQLKGTLFFRLQGMNLEFQKAQLGDLELRFGVPKELRDLPVVKDLIGDLLADVEREVRQFLRDTVPFAKLFDGFGQGAAQSLAAQVQRDAGSHGLTGISSVTRTSVQDGVVKVTVKGRVLRQPDLGNAVAEARTALEGLRPRQVPAPGKLRRPVAGR